eukprot:TRINITY_DN3174_c6_g1_i1.p1 TRINITY_DN3174_c6_g1~~TRINITY_DN3174_c6_g1_i1.p1  ORF type:complete len:172 (-),score=12.21 TRINITY_DN3174_c6_g1_i1:405-920(-)
MGWQQSKHVERKVTSLSCMLCQETKKNKNRMKAVRDFIPRLINGVRSERVLEDGGSCAKKKKERKKNVEKKPCESKQEKKKKENKARFEPGHYLQHGKNTNTKKNREYTYSLLPYHYSDGSEKTRRQLHSLTITFLRKKRRVCFHLINPREKKKKKVIPAPRMDTVGGLDL